MGSAPRVHVLTLGCAKNEVDSRRLLRILRSLGVEWAHDPQEASLLLVNTCGFITEAKEESIDAVLSLQESYPETPLVVIGCLVERYRVELEQGIPEVTAWFGVESPQEVAAFIAHALLPSGMATPDVGEVAPPTPVQTRQERSFAYVKVSDGCDHLCSFCAIPLIKGGYRAHTTEEVLREVRAETAEGAAEIVLVGQDTSLWRDGSLGVGELLGAIAAEESVARVRLMYLHPDHVDQALLAAIAATPKVCRYVDVPFQHASRAVLARMRRAGSAEDYLELLGTARRLMPEVSVRSTFIVGFPGETDDDFEELLDFVAAARFDHAGVFAFSAEEGTGAYHLFPKITSEVVRDRMACLSGLVASIAEDSNQGKIGRTFNVMLDPPVKDTGDVYAGRIEGQAPEVDGVTYLEGALPPGSRAGSVVAATITGAFGYDLSARSIGPESA